jgi:hypothetical protein
MDDCPAHVFKERRHGKGGVDFQHHDVAVPEVDNSGVNAMLRTDDYTRVFFTEVGENNAVETCPVNLANLG